MGLVANQMLIEMLSKVSQSIQDKREQKKNCDKAAKAEKKREKGQ